MKNSTYVNVVLRPSFDFARLVLLPHMLEANLAHVLTLNRAGLLNRDSYIALARVCGDMMENHDSLIPEKYDPQFEDMFFMVEHIIEGIAGEDASSNMHLGMSRNDLDTAVFRMAARERQLEIASALDGLRKTILDLAGRESRTLMLAHTHNQQAQPTTVGHYLLGIESALARHAERAVQCWGRTNLSPLGAAALAGTGFALDRHYEASLLGFEGLVENTYDAVSSADYALDTSHLCTAIASDMSRLVCDLLFWATNETNALSLDEGFIQISSIMPQKRNPVAIEHVRAILSSVMGSSAAITTTLHNIPFGDVNDSGEHTQRIMHLQCDRLLSAISLLNAALASARINGEHLSRCARSSFATSTELADTLVRTDKLPFRVAHNIVSRLVDILSSSGRQWSSLTLAELDSEVAAVTSGMHTSLTCEGLAMALDPFVFVERRNVVGGPASQSMSTSLAAHLKALSTSGEYWNSKRNAMSDYRNTLTGLSEEAGRG